MPPTHIVPHHTIEGAPEKYEITTQCFYRLTKLKALGRPFEHCSSGRNPAPVFAGARNVLMFWPGYSWNGASGPGKDTPNNRLATLVHDALYQAIRLRRVNKHLKAKFDDELFQIMKEDGEHLLRRGVWRAFRWAMSPGKGDEKYLECRTTPLPARIDTEGVQELMPRKRVERLNT